MRQAKHAAPPSRGTLLKTRLVSAANAVLYLLMLRAVVTQEPNHAGLPAWPLPLRVAAAAASIWGFLTYLHVLLRIHRWSAAERSDWMLIKMCQIPLYNIAAMWLAPSLDARKTCWPCLLLWHMGVAAMLQDLPAMHCLVLCLAIMPSTLILDYLKSCAIAAASATAANPMQQEHSCVTDVCPLQLPSLWQCSVARFMVVQGLPQILLGLAATLIPAILFMNGRQALHAPGESESEQEYAHAHPRAPSSRPASGSSAAFNTYTPQIGTPSPQCTQPLGTEEDGSYPKSGAVPLESLGIPLLRWLRLRWLFLKYEQMVTYLAKTVREPLLVCLLVVPVLGFITFVVLTRLGFQAFSLSQVSAEELLLVMMACYCLGRESTKPDTWSGVERIQLRLEAAQSLLLDVLPSHALQVMLASSTTAADNLPTDPMASALKDRDRRIGRPSLSMSALPVQRSDQAPMSSGAAAGCVPTGNCLDSAFAWIPACDRNARAASRQQQLPRHAAPASALETGVPGKHRRLSSLSGLYVCSSIDGDTAASLNSGAGAARGMSVSGAGVTTSASNLGTTSSIITGTHRTPRVSYARCAGSINTNVGNQTASANKDNTPPLDTSSWAAAATAWRRRWANPQHHSLDTPCQGASGGASLAKQNATAAVTTEAATTPQSSPQQSSNRLPVMQLPSLLSTSPLPMLRAFTHGERLVGSFKSLQSSPKSQSGTTFGGREAEGLSCRSGLPNVASAHPEVTVMFSDIVGFSTWASRLPPQQVMCTLDDLFSRLDDMILNEFPSLYKVETIGDAYILAANLLSPDPYHAATAVRFALRAQEEAGKVPRPDLSDGSTLQMRIGLHSGSIMSGIVGKIRRRWCLFGDCMNMAARTESSCPPGCVQLTSDTYELAAEALQGIVELRDHGLVKVKGHEEPLHMYLAYPLSPEWETPLASGGEEEDATGCPSDGDFSMSTCEPQATACAYHASPVSGQRHAKFFNVASTSTNIPAMPACTRGRMAFEEATAIHPGEPHKYGGFVSV